MGHSHDNKMFLFFFFTFDPPKQKTASIHKIAARSIDHWWVSRAARNTRCTPKCRRWRKGQGTPWSQGRATTPIRWGSRSCTCTIRIGSPFTRQKYTTNSTMTFKVQHTDLNTIISPTKPWKMVAFTSPDVPIVCRRRRKKEKVDEEKYKSIHKSIFHQIRWRANKIWNPHKKDPDLRHGRNK